MGYGLAVTWLRNAYVLGASELQHPVEGPDGYGDLVFRRASVRDRSASPITRL